MKRNSQSSVRRARRRQRGQMLVMVALSLVALLGFAGLVIDAGRLYYSHIELQASTDAAALAGAQRLPDTAAATAATSFSGVTGNLNARSNLPNVTMVATYPLVKCLTSLGLPCVAPGNGNAIRVKQQVTVPTTFMKLLGVSSVTLTATSTAAMRGSARAPYNVAVILDATASMYPTKIRNAMNGVQVLLKNLSPCPASASSCGSVTSNTIGGGGNVANPVDKVALFAYPPLTTATVARDYSSSSLPTTVPYATPFPSTSTYLIVNFSSDYRISDTAASLNASSNLVGAVGATTSTGYLHAVNGSMTGRGTYFAQAITMAQASLVATALPNTQNVIVILSDGDAGADASNMPGTPAAAQCHQAITTAGLAKSAVPPTRVYTVAYEAKNSSSPSYCKTDTSPPISPCAALRQMATDDSTFFQDNSSSCPGGARPTTDLNTIFTEIAGDLTVSRLIPNDEP